jgi:probable rRNA maturation factor
MVSIQVFEPLEALQPISAALQDLLVRAAQQALATACDDPQADAALVLTDDKQMLELNRTYLGIEAPTDVLAFPSGEVDPETGAYYLGDVLVSYPRAAAQAAAAGHPVEAELQLLVVHGMLHLCGYDHIDAISKAAMWERQAEILRLIGSPIRGPSVESEG